MVHYGGEGEDGKDGDCDDDGKGWVRLTDRMNFRKSSERGGGSFSIQKFILQNLDL